MLSSERKTSRGAECLLKPSKALVSSNSARAFRMRAPHSDASKPFSQANARPSQSRREMPAQALEGVRVKQPDSGIPNAALHSDAYKPLSQANVKPVESGNACPNLANRVGKCLHKPSRELVFPTSDLDLECLGQPLVAATSHGPDEEHQVLSSSDEDPRIWTTWRWLSVPAASASFLAFFAFFLSRRSFLRAFLAPFFNRFFARFCSRRSLFLSLRVSLESSAASEDAETSSPSASRFTITS
eukprot:CAMPEP_0204210498 /NCGR_PEP_ID=MMETSP0361-20130328/73973_1 /ASSEMBLY_ACC=CAM_ASM_000343 /TAXON_ID=268821 /ORGANISM="Scrippsiella Hangoei, Strain SHTV-5" /LENGTH=242 /DNA_ID=CAMNT_0051174633 /DNA_START=130 /DNA_END=856 /DNA_ORIENTATION=+